MNVNDLYKITEKYAPRKLSDDFVKLTGGYDNSGIIVDSGEEITGVLFALDLSVAAVNAAKAFGANAIITHHPAIYSPLKSLEHGTPVYSAVKAGISVISCHLNLDCAENGIDESLAEGLGAKSAEVTYKLSEKEGYGRTFTVPEISLKEFKERVEKVFDAKRIIVYGDPENTIKRVSSFCGAGLDAEETDRCADTDIFVSSDVPHHVIIKCREEGKNLLVLTHYASEFYGFKKFCDKISREIKVKNLVFDEADLK